MMSSDNNERSGLRIEGTTVSVYGLFSGYPFSSRSSLLIETQTLRYRDYTVGRSGGTVI